MRRFTRVLMAASLLLMLAGITGLVMSAWPIWMAGLDIQEEALLRPAATATPFLPEAPTLEPSPAGKLDQAAAVEVSAALPQAARADSHFAHALMDFPQEKIDLRISAAPSVNGGQAIDMRFVPGQDCEFGTGRACVSRHHSGQVILLTIHSGVGGEGERLRHALEGSGLDEAGLTIGQIRTNMANLQGAAVQLNLGENQMDHLELAVVARVPSMDLKRYFDLPFDDALDMVAAENSLLRAVLNTGEPLLAFEICGWHVPGEVWGLGSSATTASIYLGFMRMPAQ